MYRMRPRVQKEGQPAPTGETLYERVLGDVVGAGLENVNPYRRKLAAYPEGMNDFIRDVLGNQLWERQREIVEAVERYPRTTVKSSHAIGKSFVASRIVLAYLHTRPNSVVITTAPSYNQIRHILWRDIRAAVEMTRQPLLGEPLTLSYQISPDWYAMGFMSDPKKESIFQGFHAENLLLVVDEAAGVDDNILIAGEAILTGTGARSLMIGNPTSMAGAFRRSFHQDAALYHGITVSAYDTPNFTTFGITREDMLSGAWEEKLGDNPLPMPALVDPRWVSRQIQLHGAESPYVRTRIDAEFAEMDESVLIPISVIETAEAAAERPDPLEPIVAGIDVARSGSDETCICVRQGRVELELQAWKGLDTMQSVHRIRHILSKYGGQSVDEVRVDIIGLGAGLHDRLKELGYHTVEFNITQRSSDKEKWARFWHEAWWQMKEKYESGQIVPRKGREFDDTMKIQLGNIHKRYANTAHTMPEIETKDQIKRRTGVSPDRAEAQMIAFVDMPRPDRRPTSAIAYTKRKGRW